MDVSTMPDSTEGQAVSAEPLWRLGTAYFSRKTVLVAAELGVFTTLSTGAATCAELEARLNLAPRGARDFLDALVALGMLRREDGRYRNTPVSEHYLNSERPSYVGAFLASADARWNQLIDALRTGEPQNRWGSGPQMFTEQYRTTAAWRNFTAGMDYLNGMIGPSLATAFDWSSVESVLDVGGARGNLVATIVRTHPHLQAMVFDLPGVEPVFHEHAAELGLSDRISFRAGDFFTDPLPSARVIVLSHVLHDWGVGEREQIITNAFASLPEDGVLLVVDPMIDDDRHGTLGALLTSLNMLMVTPNGSEYTPAECTAWLAAAGFTGITRSALSAQNTLIVARKQQEGHR